MIPNSPVVNPYPVYNNSYPITQSMPVMQNNNPTTIMAWVQGETGALSYPMGPNTRAYLFDMNEERFFVKVSDITGVIKPLRSFRYNEETGADPAPIPSEEMVSQPEYITRDELREELEKALAGLRINNNNHRKGDTHHGKQTIRGTNESGNDGAV